MSKKEIDDLERLALDRRSLISLGALTATALPFGIHASASMANTTAKNHNEKAVIIDALGGLGNPNVMFAEYLGKDVKADPDNRWPEMDRRAFNDAHKSGLTAVNVTMGYVFGEGQEDPFEYTLREVASWDALIRKHSADLLKVHTGKDILQTKKEGKVGIIFGFQNSEMLGEDASRVQLFADLGVRVIQLTYNLRNRVGDGAMVPENKGLTEFGREVIAQLNQNHVLVDLSHGGEKLTLDALHASEVPLAITHTGCRALSEHPRNKTDEELRLLADKDGVAGIYWMPYLELGRQVYADDVVRHIDHAVNVCGEDHVGIGTDGGISQVDDMAKMKEALRADVENRKKSGVAAPGESVDIVPFTPDMTGPEQFKILAGLLDKRGYSSSRIEKILGTNFLRLMTDTWDA